jgi:hypothetical protein
LGGWQFTGHQMGLIHNFPNAKNNCTEKYVTYVYALTSCYRGRVNLFFYGSFPMLKGLPSSSICLGNFCFHFRINGSSFFSSRCSSGISSGISSRIGYHREHFGQIITPSTISSFSSKTWSSRGWCLSIGQARKSINFFLIVTPSQLLTIV